MSALPPKADIRQGVAKDLLLTQSGHKGNGKERVFDPVSVTAEGNVLKRNISEWQKYLNNFKG